MAKPNSRKLGLVLLTGIVIGSMIGGGAFNLPQNMARKAGLGAVTIAWIITLIGMFFLSNTFRILADKRPDLRAGIYRYSQEGFGPLAGFEMAWGYWLSSAFWPAPGSEDTELGVLKELEVGHGETEVYAGVQA